MTVRQSPTRTNNSGADLRSPVLPWPTAGTEGAFKLYEPANDNTDPPLPPAAAARWPRVFPGL